MPLSAGTASWIYNELAADPAFARAVEAELETLRNDGKTNRNLAILLGPLSDSGNYLLTSDVARMGGVTPGAVRLWARKGHLKHVRTANGVRLFYRREVERFVMEREVRLAWTGEWAR